MNYMAILIYRMALVSDRHAQVWHYISPHFSSSYLLFHFDCFSAFFFSLWLSSDEEVLKGGLGACPQVI